MHRQTTVIAAVSLVLWLSGCTTTSEVEPVATAQIETGEEYGNQLGAVKYVIKRGDNLVLIAAEQTHASENWRRIADFNRIQNPATIKVGQSIWIPSDLIPLNTTEKDSREVAGHPDAVVNSVRLPPKINPVGR